MNFEALAAILATFFLLGVIFFGTQCTIEIVRLKSVNRCLTFEQSPQDCKAAFDKAK